MTTQQPASWRQRLDHWYLKNLSTITFAVGTAYGLVMGLALGALR